jgi:DNA-binding NtrC family response regulator
LYSYDWPGNIRQLRNCIESAVVMSQGDTIQVEDLPPTIAESRGENAVHIPLGITMAEAEKAIILENLAFFKGNKSKTADSLGIGRKTIHRKLDDYLATDERESQE